MTKLERARNLGADHGINHRNTDIVGAVQALTGNRGVDVVLDSVGGEVWQKSLASLDARRASGDLRRHGGRPTDRRYRGDLFEGT